MSEYAKLWKNKDYKNIELLSASFKDFAYSKHWHDEYAIGLIQKGVESLNFNGCKIDIPENHIVAINPGEIHTGFAGCDSGWTYRMFYFEQSLIDEFIQDKNIKNLPSLIDPLIKDKELFNKLLQLHISLEEEQFTLKRDSLLISSLNELFSKHSNIKIKNEKLHKDFSSNKLIKEYIEDNYKENISLEELSLLVQKDKYQIIRSFKKQFGVTPHQFLIQIKIQNSKKLLEKGLDISSSALDSGFFDQSHFGKNFKAKFGITPKKYQEHILI